MEVAAEELDKAARHISRTRLQSLVEMGEWVGRWARAGRASGVQLVVVLARGTQQGGSSSATVIPPLP